jgi:hypothetical protein
VKQGLARTTRLGQPLIVVLIAVGMEGCDPVINIAGANFPAWLLCLLVGAGLAASSAVRCWCTPGSIRISVPPR